MDAKQTFLRHIIVFWIGPLLDTNGKGRLEPRHVPSNAARPVTLGIIDLGLPMGNVQLSSDLPSTSAAMAMAADSAGTEELHLKVAFSGI
jgi:hypothetical protein